MAEIKIAKSWGIGCARQTLIAGILLILFIAGFIGLVALSAALPLSSDRSVFLWAGGLFLLIFLIIGVVIIWAIHQVKKRADQLDLAFLPQGLMGRGYLWNERQYHGNYHGRQVHAYIYRGPCLDLYLESPINTKMGIGPKGSLSRMAANAMNRRELATYDPLFADLVIYTLDEAWARKLLEVGRARTDILKLATNNREVEFRNLLLQPEAVHLQINRVDLLSITSDNLSSWLNDLLDLAQVVEILPPPAVTAAVSPMERRARIDRGGYSLPLVSLTCGIIGFFVVLFIALLLVVINLGKAGL